MQISKKIILKFVLFCSFYIINFIYKPKNNNPTNKLSEPRYLKYIKSKKLIYNDTL